MAALATAWCGACSSPRADVSAVQPRSTDEVAPAPAGSAAASGHPSPHASVGDFLATHFSGDAWRDDVVRDYLTAPPVLVPAGLAVAAVAIRPWDRSVERHLDDRFGRKDGVADAGLTALVAGSLAVGVLAPGEGRAASEETWDQVETFALTLGATEGLKSLVGRRRPDSHQRGSFPSGHASVAFAAATMIYDNSGPDLGIPAYAVASVTALARVHHRGHFPSDALGGAGLGVLSAGVIDALHFGTGRQGRGIARRGPDISLGLEPGLDRGVALALTLQF
jgi:hypothetical protein